VVAVSVTDAVVYFVMCFSIFCAGVSISGRNRYGVAR